MSSSLGILSAAGNSDGEQTLDKDYCLVHDSLFSMQENGVSTLNLNETLLFARFSLSPQTRGVPSPESLPLPSHCKLTRVYLEAATLDGLHYAENHPKSLLDAILREQPIIRQGESFEIISHISEGSSRYTFTVVSSEPLKQGFAVHTDTVFCVALSETSAISDFSSHFNDSIPAEYGWEVDENFISASISLKSFPTTECLPIIPATFKPVLTAPAVEYNEAGSLFTAASLGVRVPAKILSAVGLFDGDWALLSTAQGQGVRLIKVHLWFRDNILGVPAPIFRTMFPSTDPNGRKPRKVGLSGITHGKGNPPIPIADTVVLSRISSPASTDSALQSATFSQLRECLEIDDITLKLGDLISVHIRCDLARAHHLDKPERPSVNLKPWTRDQVLRFPDPQSAAIHFRVANVSQQTYRSALSSEPRDANAILFALGETGCLVSKESSKVIQRGVENGSVQPTGCDHRHNVNVRHLFNAVSGYLHTFRDNLEMRPSFLLRGLSSDNAAAKIVRSVSETVGLHLVEFYLPELLDGTAKAVKERVEAWFMDALSCAPCLLLLRRLDFLEKLSGSTQDIHAVIVVMECLRGLKAETSLFGSLPVIVIGTLVGDGQLPGDCAEFFTQELVIQAPHESERFEVLNHDIQGRAVSDNLDVARLAVQSAAFSWSDLETLIRESATIAADDVLSAYSLQEAAGSTRLSQSSFESALVGVRSEYLRGVGAPTIPSVQWSDVGGLHEAKTEILETIQLPLEHPEYFQTGLRPRSGLLLYGPPGTGKTMLAKAVATSFSLNFFSVKGPELLNMYIGESEANVRRVFQKARDAEPCVVFFDELDSIAPSRGLQGDSGGVMDRIVSQLLAELDGIMSSDTTIFVMAATNRPDLLDPALLRPGRFDRTVYLGVSETHDAQAHIIEALTRNLPLENTVDLTKIASLCPLTYTGADFYALCSDAMHTAMSRTVDNVESKIALLNQCHPGPPHPQHITATYFLSELAIAHDYSVTVNQGDFHWALERLVPSVSLDEMRHYEQVKKQFEKQVG